MANFQRQSMRFFVMMHPITLSSLTRLAALWFLKRQLQKSFKNQTVNTQALHTGNHVELMDCGATVRDRCSFKHRGWTSRRTRSAHPSQIPINDHRVQAFVPKACTSSRFFAQYIAREAFLFVPPFGKDKSFTIVTLGARTCLITPLSNHRFSATPLIHR